MNKTTDLYVFIDGFGWELLKQYPDFLSHVVKTQSRTESVLGYSNTCIPSILTGKRPEEHQQWASYYKAQGDSPFASLAKFAWLPSLLCNHPRFRRKLNQHLAKSNGFKGYFESYTIPLGLLSQLAYTETSDIFQPQAFNGHNTIFKTWAERGVSYRAFYKGRDKEKTEALCRDLQLDSPIPEKLYLHLNQLDGVLHANPKESPAVQRCLEETQSLIEQSMSVIMNSGITPRLHVFSDHGMCTIAECFNLKAYLQKQFNLRPGKDYFGFLDATMARFWSRSTANNNALKHALSHCEAGTLLSNKQRKALHISQQNLEKYGDIVFLANPSVLLLPNDLSTRAPYAMHGYDTHHQDSYGIYLSSETHNNPPQSICEIFRHEFTQQPQPRHTDQKRDDTEHANLPK